jgi:hypothetical protein
MLNTLPNTRPNTQPIQRYRLIHKLIFWLITEIILNLVGLDNIADYGEFLLSEHIMPISAPLQIVKPTLGELISKEKASNVALNA